MKTKLFVSQRIKLLWIVVLKTFNCLVFFIYKSFKISPVFMLY